MAGGAEVGRWIEVRESFVMLLHGSGPIGSSIEV